MRLAALVVIVTAGISCTSPPSRQASGPALRWVPDPASPGQATVEARGVEWEGWAVERALRVYARPASGNGDAPVPPMLGAYELKDGVVRFRPGFPLEPGMRYEAVLELRRGSGAADAVLTSTYAPPSRPEVPPALVARVYPSADELPENLLKFYVHFSVPMSRGGVYRHVHLLDDAGREVELPFLELDEELWDPGITRLTLFIDPGRIKRGVRPLEEIGPALEQGKRYTLLIDRGLVDATGRELGQEFRKSFTVGAPDRDPPDPTKWKLTPPAASSRGPLMIEFPDVMDHALAERLIRVTAAGRVVPGAVSLGEAERHWIFTPTDAWRAGRYDVVVQPTIEDLAGNNVGKPFEVDLDAGGKGAAELAPVKLPVDVR